MAKQRVEGTVADLDVEDSLGMVGAVGKVVPAVSKRKTGGSRPSYDDAAHCPHCTGRMHMNLPAATINFECLWRQFALAKGLIKSPDERLPIFAAGDLAEMAEWSETRTRSRKNPLAYGKMSAASGAATSYAALKSATKTVDEVAADVDVNAKRGKKSKAVVATTPAGPKIKTGTVAKTAAPAVKASKRTKTSEDDLFDFEDMDTAPVKRSNGSGKVKLKGSQTATKTAPVAATPEPKARPKLKVVSGGKTPTADAKSVKAPNLAKGAIKRRAVLARS